MKCPGCKQNNSSGADFCRKCGAPVTGGPSYAELQRTMTEALDQQTATSEIMRVISRSPTDVQPVFDAIVQSATRLCDATWAAAFRFDGERQTLTAQYKATASELEVLHREFPRPLTRDRATGRAIVDRRVVHIPDIQEDPEYAGAPLRAVGFRTVLAVPMLHDGEPIGVLGLWRREARSFTEKQIDLVSTFADQAVLAIENVRLFKELEARNSDLTTALDQQTATSEVLRVISQSPTDVQPVFEAIAENATRLCDANDVSILEEDRGLFRVAAFRGASRLRDFEGTPISRGSVAGRAMLDGQLIHVHDITQESGTEFPVSKDFAPHMGHRTMLATPLLREGAAIGVIFVRRTEVRPFSDKQIALLQTFADQAVIAIENVRLFKELEARNRDLTTALEQQTATAEILRVISDSPTDVQPVFDAVAESVRRLCRGMASFVCSYDGKLVHLVAVSNVNPEGADAWRQAFPRPPSRATAVARAILTGEVVMIPDVLEDSEYTLKDAAQTAGFRSGLAVPMLREGKPIGGIATVRAEPGPFSPIEIELLKTFADQAVIAIGNVRLFKELEAKNRDLTRALDQQTATSEILRVISSSPTDVQPVFDAIIHSAQRLVGAHSGAVFRRLGDEIHLAAYTSTDATGDAVVTSNYPIPVAEEVTRNPLVGRVWTDGAIEHVADVEADPRVPDAARTLTRARGYRGRLMVPMRRGDPVTGALSVTRRKPGPFSNDEIALLQTFAEQAAIAIENVRLFTELEARNRDLTTALDRQTATSEILRVISSSPTDVQPVFDAILRSAMALCDAMFGTVFRVDGDLVRLVATRTPRPEELATIYPAPLASDFPPCRAIRENAIIHFPDVEAVDTIPPAGLRVARQFAIRSLLVVPMRRDETPIGAIFVARTAIGPFPDEQIGLLHTFADQAVIAIENVRLFKELQARTAELTRSVGELKALGEVGQAVSSTLDLETVLSTIVSRANDLAGMDGGAIYEYDEGREEFSLRATEQRTPPPH